ncbi:MAG: type II secretion system protein [Candidatus Omnitrophica bacterium]|nr:type II secretion system protein [Candidatus Omnitrophota bacterium]
MKKGFTLIEVLVGGLILVIAMALIAVLYGKAAKIRTIVSGEADIQGVANQMMDTIISGGGSPLEGLRCATKIYQIDTSDPPLYISFGNCDGVGRKVKFQIFSTTKSLHKKKYSIGETIYSIANTDPDLDINDKIDLQDSSRFYFYKSNEESATTPSEVAKIMICLAAKSSLSAISRTIILYNSVTIRNIYHID